MECDSYLQSVNSEDIEDAVLYVEKNITISNKNGLTPLHIAVESRLKLEDSKSKSNFE